MLNSKKKLSKSVATFIDMYIPTQYLLGNHINSLGIFLNQIHDKHGVGG